MVVTVVAARLGFFALRFLLFALVVIVARGAFAQSRLDRAYIAETISGNSTIEETGRTSRELTTELSVGTPALRFADASYLLATLYGRRTWLSGADPHDGNTLLTSEARLGVIYGTQLAPRWGFSIIPTVGFRGTSDADFRLSKDLSLNAIVLVGYQIDGNPRFVVSAGFVYTNSSSFSPIIPIAGLRYWDERWRIEITWPQPQFAYTFADRFEVGAGMRFDYPLYRIVPIDYGSERAEYARLTNHFANALLGVRLTKDLWLSAKVGVLFGRVVRLTDEDRNNIDSGKQTLGTAPFATFIFSYRGQRR